jgi:hypothetical protein
MIISNSHRFIFIHIHKCAGSTITNLLSPHTEWNDLELGCTVFGESLQNLYRPRFGLWKHASAAAARKVVGEDIYNNYFKFAFVRNPFDRTVSFYTFIQKHIAKCDPEDLAIVEQWPIARALRATSSFSEFIRHEGFIESPMFRLVTAAPENRNQLLVDFVGRVENFDVDIATVLNHIGIDSPSEIKQKNTSKVQGKTFIDFYQTEDDLRVVYEKYKHDFDLFGYSLDEAILKFQADNTNNLLI